MEYDVIYNGDCLAGMRGLPDQSVDLIVTDPPYRMTARGNHGNAGGMLARKIGMAGKVFENNDCGVREWMPQLHRVLKSGSHCYVMCNHINLVEYLNEAEKCGFHFIKSLIWDKRQKIMGTAYMSQFEYILFFRKGKFKRVRDCGVSDIIPLANEKPKGRNGENLHDTSKPVQLMEILIKQSSDDNDVVLDPFMGIGTTAIACKRLNRRYLGYEIDKQYYDIAVRRLNEEFRQQSLF